MASVVTVGRNLEVSGPDLGLPVRPIAGAVELRFVKCDPVHQLVWPSLTMTDGLRRTEVVDDANELASPWPVPTGVLYDSDPSARTQSSSGPRFRQGTSQDVLDRRTLGHVVVSLHKLLCRHVTMVVEREHCGKRNMATQLR
jgi:hypothetical protein